MQYELAIQNGATIKEDGTFFKAAPFQIETAGKTYHVAFTRQDHKVVYGVTTGGHMVAQLHHPDYLPDEDPARVNAGLESVFAALVRLEIAKGPHAAYYRSADITPELNYLVKQEQFL
jgi:hypothetical protein